MTKKTYTMEEQEILHKAFSKQLEEEEVYDSIMKIIPQSGKMTAEINEVIKTSKAYLNSLIRIYNDSTSTTTKRLLRMFLEESEQSLLDKGFKFIYESRKITSMKMNIDRSVKQKKKLSRIKVIWFNYRKNGMSSETLSKVSQSSSINEYMYDPKKNQPRNLGKMYYFNKFKYLLEIKQMNLTNLTLRGKPLTTRSDYEEVLNSDDFFKGVFFHLIYEDEEVYRGRAVEVYNKEYLISTGSSSEEHLPYYVDLLLYKSSYKKHESLMTRTLLTETLVQKDLDREFLKQDLEPAYGELRDLERIMGDMYMDPRILCPSRTDILV